MKKLVAIGEALIDMIAADKDCAVKDAGEFRPKVGGAPANVCGAYAKLGGEARLITMLGRDAFGDKIVKYLTANGIDCSCVSRTDEANTALAFVSRDRNGERSFSFYRNPSADMLLSETDLKKEWFEDCFALHFCSVSLGEFPMKKAHVRAIEYARDEGAIISFDPNLRFALWRDTDRLKQAVNEFLPRCDILKLSEDEVEFITGKTDIKDALGELLNAGVKLVLLTKGGGGATAINEKISVEVAGEKANVVDTTGAGDAFIGSFLYSLAADGIGKDALRSLSSDELKKYLEFSNRYGARSVEKEGAIESYPTAEEMNRASRA